MTHSAYKWIGGLISAVASGITGAAGVVVIDPAGFAGEWTKLGMVAALMAAIGVANYLKQYPLPPLEDE